MSVDYLRASAADLVAALEAGEVTSVELTQLFLDRIAAVDGQVNAFLHVDAEGALAQATASDERRAAGNPAPPLGRVPVAVQDLLAPEGIPHPLCPKNPQGW